MTLAGLDRWLTTDPREGENAPRLPRMCCVGCTGEMATPHDDCACDADRHACDDLCDHGRDDGRDDWREAAE